jgi:predicted secreted protein
VGEPDPSLQDVRLASEPLGGGLVRVVLIALVVGAPVFLMFFAVFHMNTVQQGMVMARAMGNLPPDLTDMDLYFIVALEPALILYSVGRSCGVTTVLVLGVAVVATVWWVSTWAVSGLRGRAAFRRYGRMVGDDAQVAPDAWSHDLPEPDEDPSDEPTDGGRGGP